MKKYTIFLFFISFLNFNSFAQMIFKTGTGFSVSHISYSYTYNLPEDALTVSSPISSFMYYAELSSCWQAMPGLRLTYGRYFIPKFEFPKGISTRNSYNSWSLEPFLHFKLGKHFAIQPQLSFNLENIYFRDFMSYSVNFQYHVNKLSFELFTGNYPDFITIKSSPSNVLKDYYLISRTHYPLFGFNLAYSFNNPEKLQKRFDQKKAIFREYPHGLRIETGSMLLGGLMGVSYQFKQNPGVKHINEVGIRMAYNPDLYFLPLAYYSMKWPLVDKENYRLLAGFEAGGGPLLGWNIVPFPHLFLFVENEFSRWVFKTGGGTGIWLVTAGIKLNSRYKLELIPK